MEVNHADSRQSQSTHTGHSLYLGASRLLTDQKTYAFALVFFASLAVFGADFCGLFLAVFAVGYLFHLCDPDIEEEQESNCYSVYGIKQVSSQQQNPPADFLQNLFTRSARTPNTTGLSGLNHSTIRQQ